LNSTLSVGEEEGSFHLFCIPTLLAEAGTKKEINLNRRYTTNDDGVTSF